MKINLKILITFFVSSFCFAQQIDYETMTSILLEDGTSVILFGKMDEESNQDVLVEKWWKKWFNSETSQSDVSELAISNNEYYYLPPQNSLRLAKNQDGSPKFTLIKYSGNTKKDSRGGILSFSMVFGLTKNQESELKEKLKEVNPKAKIKGSVQLWPKVGLSSGEVNIGYAKIGKEEENSITKTAAPLGENGKFSVVMKLDNESFQILEDSFRSNVGSKPIDISLSYSYSVDVEGFTASMTFERGKYQELIDDFERATTRVDHRKWIDLVHDKTEITLDQTRTVFNELREAKVIIGDTRVDTNYMSEERVQEIESQFYTFFFESFAQPAEFESTKSRSASIDSLETSLAGLGNNYEIKIDDTTINNFMSRSSFNLSARTATRKEWGFNSDFQLILENMDLDNEKHFREINFDDPFFATREISVQLSANLSDLVGNEVNGVEVRLRKKKKNGDYYYFDDQGSIFFNKKGDAGQLRSYNLGHDINGDKTIGYMTVINHRGGFVEKNKWKDINETANIFVNTSLESKIYKVKADLEDFKEHGIVAAICRIAYLKDGKQAIKEILIDPDNDDSGIKEFNLVMDKGLKGYCVKLIFMHKTRRKPIIIPWNEKRMFSLPFIFLAIPERLKGMSEETLDNYFEKYDFSNNDENEELLNKDGTLKEDIKKEGYDIFEKNN